MGFYIKVMAEYYRLSLFVVGKSGLKLQGQHMTVIEKEKQWKKK